MTAKRVRRGGNGVEGCGVSGSMVGVEVVSAAPLSFEAARSSGGGSAWGGALRFGGDVGKPIGCGVFERDSLQSGMDVAR